ncbi:MAG TPA: hypothetical protein VF471_03050 [Pseudoxanthomonas sp.]
MTNPNPQLQAVIAQFAAQPGVTPDQQAQLRASIIQDNHLLQLLNQDAANNHIKGFALSQAGATSNPTGMYDIASGMITLPATSFRPIGTAPSADLTATLRVQDMSVRFAHSTYQDSANVTRPVTQDMVTNLQSTINGSPVLSAEIKRAVTPPGHGQDAPLQRFASLSGTVAGGTYDSTTHTMSLPPTSLAKPSANFDSTDLTFVLGHEIQHGFNAASKKIATDYAYNQARQIAQDNSPVNDYTVPIRNVIQAGREDEAKAQIAGWNALLSREQQTKPTADLTDMMKLAKNNKTSRVLDFVEPNSVNRQQGQARAGLTFNADNTMSMTPANVAQMGKNYFDKPPKGTPGVPAQQTTGIGFHGDSDYPNSYGANAVTNVISVDRTYARTVNGMAPQMQINMGQLRLREDLMERNGITLTTNPGTPQPYYDTSQPSPVLHHFDHTHNQNHLNEQNAHQHVPVVPGLSPERSRAPRESENDIPVPKPNPQSELSPTKDFSAYLDRMLAAAQTGDDTTFRKMTQTLADLPPGREMRAEAVATVDRQEQLATQQQMDQQRVQQMEAPVMRMHR